MTSNLKKVVLNSTLWSVFSQIGSQSLNFLLSIVLIRLLTPEDFGLMGMVLVFSRLSVLFSDNGFGSALVQELNINETHLSSVFWLNIFSGGILTALLVILAPLISNFYSEERLVPVIMMISFSYFISSANIVQYSILNRKMAFKKLAIIDLLSQSISGIIAIILALAGYGVYALAWQVIALAVISSILLWVTTNWYPKRIFCFKSIKSLSKFSLNLLGLQFFNYWVRNADNLLIGKYLGTVSLGIYTRAYSIMLMPVNQVSRVLNSVMFSALSKIQTDKIRVKKIYLDSIRTISLITFPISIGLFVVARPFVIVLFGERWEGIIEILKILCFIGLFQSIATTTGWIYNSQGRTDIAFKWGIIGGTLTFIAFIIGLKWGTLGVAWAYCIRVYLTSYFHLSIPGRLIGLSFTEIILNLFPTFLLSITMGGIVYVVPQVLSIKTPLLFLLAFQVILGIFIYLFLNIIFKVKAFNDLCKIIKNHLG